MALGISGIPIAVGCMTEAVPNILILASTRKPLADHIGMNELPFFVMMIAARALRFVFFMLMAVLLIAHVPAISTTLLPDIDN